VEVVAMALLFLEANNLEANNLEISNLPTQTP
jgi:hypothetical protein